MSFISLLIPFFLTKAIILESYWWWWQTTHENTIWRCE